MGGSGAVAPAVTVELPTVQDTLAFGRGLGARMRAGDLVLLVGDLGAGKTTLTKGIAAGLGVTGTVTSPTFVLARVHRARPDGGPGPALVHVDSYRLGGSAELDDLDLDTDLSRAAVVVEWGEGIAEGLAEARLVVRLTRHPDDRRTAVLEPLGGDWAARVGVLARTTTSPGMVTDTGVA
jgi:tRNA threonylcarbamoyladenosine biosynthesis protein TsaE